MKTVTQANITHQVFEAIEEGKALPLGVKCSLEYLSSDYDGVFESDKNWRGFINGNFLSDYDRHCWRDTVKETTIKKWCYDVEKFSKHFVQQIAKDVFVSVNPEDLEFTFDYELYYSRNREDCFPSAVEIFVIAKFKA